MCEIICVSGKPGKGCFMIFCLIALSSGFSALSRPEEIHNKELDSGNSCKEMVNRKRKLSFWKAVIKGIN